MLSKINDIVAGFISILKGLAVTGKNMLKKPVTIQYPFEKPVMTEKFRGLVDLYPEKCIACSQCVKICPTAALDLTATTNPETKKRFLGAFSYNGELCCFCGLCQEVCPTAAMYLNKCYEVAYYKHGDLTKIDLLKADKYQHLTPPKVKGLKK
ncbi:MAG: NADH-quinone oxidoreductase subunit I [Candidatus Omnitrophica bacterium]|nr:NADH-quinone oxidoreductase subunit I [Candidatus Omnitrophota bacterium]